VTMCRGDYVSRRLCVTVTVVIPRDQENLEGHRFPQRPAGFRCVRLRIGVQITVMAEKPLPINDALSALAAEWGRRGGNARREKLTPEQRRQSARLAAQARWAKKAGAPDPTDPKGPDRDQRWVETGIQSRHSTRGPSGGGGGKKRQLALFSKESVSAKRIKQPRPETAPLFTLFENGKHEKHVPVPVLPAELCALPVIGHCWYSVSRASIASLRP
jgi:hypothetical protein